MGVRKPDAILPQLHSWEGGSTTHRYVNFFIYKMNGLYLRIKTANLLK